MSERPVQYQPRRLADWLNPTGEKKVHSLVDKVYKMENLEVAWKQVKRNAGGGGIDAETIESFGAKLNEHLTCLQQELRDNTYRPKPVKQCLIPKAGQPGKYRALGIPTIYDRVCQQALLNRLEPIFEPIFDEASFGYRRGRSAKDALRKIWRELEEGYEWIVDADLKDFLGSVDHEKLLTLINQQIADGRVLRLIKQFLKSGCVADAQWQPTESGTPQGGVISPLLSNILLTPFDREMRRKGYQLTRYSDDWLITCKSQQEAENALKAARQILEKLGVSLHEQKTGIIHVKQGFEFLGYKIKRGSRPLRLKSSKIKSGVQQGDFYAYPRNKSLLHFKDQIRRLTKRTVPLSTQDLIKVLNPVIRGWGLYYCKAHVRGLFKQLNPWIVRRIWSHRHKRWRNTGWKELPENLLYGAYGLVNLVTLIPSLNRTKYAFVKAAYGKTVRAV